MQSRCYTVPDRVLGEIDKIIKVLASPAHARRALPGAAVGELEMDAEEQRLAGRLMRINHAGEIAAQALYQGQALTARDDSVRDTLREAAAEEMDHLAWCEARLRELGTHPSRLNGVWYAGSYAIGAVAGAFGDRASLGFIVETEAQVEAHLRNHLDRLPAADRRSRCIVEQMAADEASHGARAVRLGARNLPLPVAFAMRMVSRVMTLGAYWL